MTLTGDCHCGRNAFEIQGELPEKLTRRTCSFCSKRGRLYACYQTDQLKVTEAKSGGIYRWQTKLVAHHFCSACGWSLYSDSPAFDPDGHIWDPPWKNMSAMPAGG